MDQTVLVDSEIVLGKKAAEAFDKSGPPAQCVFWLYAADAGEWRLTVVTRVVDDDGPRAAYSRIARALDDNGLADSLPLRRVTAMETQAPLVQLLRRAVRTGPGITGIRFTNNVINGVHIDDAYIYRMQ